jgi:predicted dehydrogenase
MKLALIGSGGIGRKHVEEFKKLAETDPERRVEVVACADVNFQNAINLKGAFGIEHAYADWREMLTTRPEIEAVSICTPNGHHADPAVEALDRGLHVMVEKPMAMNAEECQRMNEAAERSGKTLVVGFQYRFDERTTLIKDQLDAGVLGDVMYCRVQALRRRGIPNWGVFGRKDVQGGGPLIDWGIHALDVAHYLMGNPEPTAALGGTWTYLGNHPDAAANPWRHWDHTSYTVEDLACGSIQFATGQVLSIETSFAAHIEEDVFNVTLMGTRGGANWAQKKLHTDRDGYMWNSQPAYVPPADMWQAKMKHFIDATRGEANISNGQDGQRIQKMMDLLYASGSSVEQARPSAEAGVAETASAS